MDANTFALYVHELRNQCMYTEAALGLFNQAMEKKSSTGVFFATQGFMTSVSNICRLLWPQRIKAKRRGDELRRVLGIKADHPLNDSRLNNFWEYGDERTDDWIKNSRGQLIAFDFLGPKHAVGNRIPKDEHIYRLYDPESRELIYRGESFNLQELASHVAALSARINQVHDQLFPKKEGEDQAQVEAAPDTTQGEAAPDAPEDKTESEPAAKPEKKAEAPAKA